MPAHIGSDSFDWNLPAADSHPNKSCPRERIVDGGFENCRQS